MSLLTVKEAAKQLGLSVGTVRNYIRRGMIPAVKFHRAVRIDEKDLERFVEAHKRGIKQDEGNRVH